MKEFKIHFIENNKLTHVFISTVPPSVNDEIRLGGEGREIYYKVIRRIFVYDEPVNPYYRINIEIELI